MHPVPITKPTSGRQPVRVWRQLILLFAGVLMLGLIHPVTASAAASGLLVKDATVSEHSSHAIVRIVLPDPVSHRVSVRFTTLNGTAKAGQDYRAVSGRVVFPAGSRVQRVSVPIINDTVDEANEFFRVRIFDPVHARIVDPVGNVRILDDDVRPSVSVADVTTVEPDSGSAAMNFPVTLSAASGRTAAVTYTVTAGTATAGSDYSVATPTGQLVFPAGTTTRYVHVTVLGDTVQEPDETLDVTLSSPVNLLIADGSAVGTITDTDQPALSVEDVTVTEGETATFVVDLSKPAGQAVTFHYATSNGTAVAPGDYTASSGTKTIAAGASSTTVTVPTTEDHLNEATETFLLNVSDVTNAVVADGQAKATILDDDAAPSMSIGDTHATEGSPEVFTVTLSRASSFDVSADWATQDGTAKAPGDYTAAHGDITIPAGHLTGHISVATVDDHIDEVNETFAVVLSSPHHATIGDGHGEALIVDNDGPSVSIGDAHATEGSPVVFPVSLSVASVQDVKVDWFTSNGTATAPADYTAAHGTVTIPAGHLLAQVSIATVDDAIDEADTEGFGVTLTNPVNATIADHFGQGLIVDNDALPSLSVSDAHATEGSHVVFTVTLSAASGRAVSVDWATSDGTATAPADYTAAHGTVTIPAGHLLAQVSIATVDDAIDEA
ncbi:MAG: Calx-beta domain-containing protein, partial [Actinomycetes bacterium]